MKIKTISLSALLSMAIVSVPARGNTTGEPIVDSLITDEIVVTGSRPSVNVNNLPMSVSVVTGQQLERRMEQSVLPLLTEQVPGLFIASRGVMGYSVAAGSAGNMTMRGVGGAPTTQMLVLIDGHPQYMGLMGHPLPDMYQTMMVERVEVVRGPASVLYGSNAMGGVINIITKQQRQDGVKTHLKATYGSYNTFSGEASNSVRAGKFSSYVSLGYNRTDGHRENMGFEQYSGYTKLGYDFSDNWKSFVDLDVTHFNSSNPGPVYNPLLDNDADVTRLGASFSLQNNYDKTSGAFKFFYNYGYHRINDGYAANGGTPRTTRYRSKDDMMGLTVYQNYSFFRGNQTTVGADFQHYGGHAWTKRLNGDPNTDLARESLNEVAGYVNFQQMLAEKLTLNAGVRFDHHSVTGNQWIPQGGISYFAGRNTVLKAIVSKGFRNPTIRELYMFGTRNPDLKPESLMNYEISLTQYALGGDLNLGLNLYYLKGKNSIIEVQGDEGWQWRNTGKIENYGVEATAAYRIDPNWSVNANYSYLHMKNKVIASPEHKLYAGIDYTTGKWSFATGVQFIRNLVKDEEGGRETFTLWNARVSFRATDWMDIFARGENLLAQKYEINTGYPMPRATVFAGVTVRL